MIDSLTNKKISHEKSIHTAVILAAGRGTRLEEMTEFLPKCLIEVHGKSLLERMLDQLNENGFKKVIIVVGYKSEKIVERIGFCYKNIHLTYVENKYWETTNNVLSLYLAENSIKEDFILLESDLILADQAFMKLKQTNLMAVETYQSFMDGTVVDLDENNKVKAMYLKSSPNRPLQLDKLFKTVNIYSFKVEEFQFVIVPILKEILDEGKTNVYYELAFERAIAKGLINFEAINFGIFKWAEIDNQEDWRRASALFEPDYVIP